VFVSVVALVLALIGTFLQANDGLVPRRLG
jgi:hypothetical protein